MPERIQLRRTKGWRLPEGAVSVARPTDWGNPFTVDGAIESGYASTEEQARKSAVDSYRSWLLGEDVIDLDRYQTRLGGRLYDRVWVREHLHELRGKNLACWCPLPEPGQPDVCHAAVLIALANPASKPGLPDRHRILSGGDPSWWPRFLAVIDRDHPEVASEVLGTAIAENAAETEQRKVRSA